MLQYIRNILYDSGNETNTTRKWFEKIISFWMALWFLTKSRNGCVSMKERIDGIEQVQFASDKKTNEHLIPIKNGSKGVSAFCSFFCTFEQRFFLLIVCFNSSFVSVGSFYYWKSHFYLLIILHRQEIQNVTVWILFKIPKKTRWMKKYFIDNWFSTLFKSILLAEQELFQFERTGPFQWTKDKEHH